MSTQSNRPNWVVLSLCAALAITIAILLWGRRGHEPAMQQFYGRPQ